MPSLSPPITGHCVRNLRIIQIAWLLGAAFLPTAFAAPSPVANIVLDSQESATHLGKSILAQYKPERRLQTFLPAQWWFLSDAEKQGLHALFESWQKTGRLSLDEVRGWVELTVSLHRSQEDGLWGKLKRRFKNHAQVPYLMSFLPARLEDAFTAYQKHLDDPRRPIRSIEVSRVDSADHPELAGALVWLRSAGYSVRVDKKSPEQIETEVAALADHTDKELLRLVSGLDHSLPRITRLSLRERAMQQIRYQLGIVRGMSVIHFQLAAARTPAEKAVEAGAGVTIASVASYCVFKTVRGMQLAGQAVSTWLPMVVTVAEKLFFQYYGRSTSAFFGQGLSFDFNTNRFEKNKLFFVLSTFMNSLFLRELMMMTTHTQIDLAEWTVQFGVTWGAIVAAAGSSVRGLFSKFSLQLGIEKLREQLKNRPWLTLGILVAWNAAWAVVQVGDLYGVSLDVPVPGVGQVKLDARAALGTLALVGLAHEQIRDWKGWKRRGRLLLEKLGLRKRTVCESLLVIQFSESTP